MQIILSVILRPYDGDAKYRCVKGFVIMSLSLHVARHLTKRPRWRLLGIPLRMAGKAKDGTVTFTGEYVVQENGPHSYGVRIMPYNRNLASKQELGLVLWG